MSPSSTLALGDAVTVFISSASKGPSVAQQQELQRFVRWSGRERRISEITPHNIEEYCANRSADSIKTLAPVKEFLSYVHAEGHSTFNLAPHLKVKRASSKLKVIARTVAAANQADGPKMTKEGHAKAMSEVEDLRSQRVAITDDIKKAMADKDFRENAPLDAARDKQAHLESRIRELEHILEHAEVIGDNGKQAKASGKASLGSKVSVTDMTHDEELTYILVDPSEVDSRQGRISVQSPAGKAFLGKPAGQIVTVKAPAGNLRYRIDRVES